MKNEKKKSQIAINKALFRHKEFSKLRILPLNRYLFETFYISIFKETGRLPGLDHIFLEEQYCKLRWVS